MKDRLTNITFLAILFLLSDNIYPLTWPIPKGTSGRYSITSTLGEFKSATRTHKGIDIGVSYSPVVSPVDGVITIKKENDGAAGNWLEIKGINGILYRFYHLNNDEYFEKAQKDMAVREGERIATSGESGSAVSHPHLHFELGDEKDPENPLLYFDIPDTNNGVIGEVYFKSVDKLFVLKDGMIFNKSKPFPESGEFIVNAYDISNTGSNHVNFYKIVSTIDNKVLKEWEFNVSHTDEASLLYSISNPTSTISNFYYRMGEWLSEEGKHFFTIEGYDLNNSTPRFSTGKTIKFIIDYTPPQIGLKQPPDIIWVPPSEWPGGDYKSSINYPVKISFDAIDNIAVDDVYAYVDGKLVGRWEDLESDIFLSTTTLCGWSRHTLTITATDLAGI
jgi:hypothetical protein